MLPRVVTTHQVLVRLRDSTTILVLVLAGLALASDGTAGRVALQAALATLAVKVVVAVIGMLWAITVSHDVTGDWLLVSGVHEDFVLATMAVTTRPDTPPQRSVKAESASVSISQATAPDGS